VLDLIVKSETDDPTLIVLFNSLLEGFVTTNKPEQLYLVRIDNWFDQKWLGFSGNGTAKSGRPDLGGRFLGMFESIKVVFHNNKLTLPPFNPNRIVSQRCFVRSESDYIEAPLRPPHRFTKQSSELNLHRRIEDAYSSACLVWYSSNTIANDRASFMAYAVNSGETESWYSSFLRKSAWNLNSTKGISKEKVQALMAKGTSLREDASHSASVGLVEEPLTPELPSI
jgi:hypothetical protein